MSAQRNDIRPLPRWVAATAVTGTVGIALGAFWLSFTALVSLAALAGVPRQDAWIWPLIVDGIIVVATISVVALSPRGVRATAYPWMLLGAGSLISVAANAAHALVTADAAVPKPLAACVSAVPPVILLAMTHLTVELTRQSEAPTVSSEVEARHPIESPPTETTTPASADLALSGDSRAVAARLRETGASNRAIARQLGVHPSTIGRWLPGARDASRQ